MKQEHKYAQVLRWIADGENVQRKDCAGTWRAVAHCEIFAEMSRLAHPAENYRIAPKTIKIGSREVEAPLSTVKDDERVLDARRWFLIEFDSSLPDHCAALNKGRLFASAKAAAEFDDAITALVLEQCK